VKEKDSESLLKMGEYHYIVGMACDDVNLFDLAHESHLCLAFVNMEMNPQVS
jgi:hypothetical protein